MWLECHKDFILKYNKHTSLENIVFLCNFNMSNANIFKTFFTLMGAVDWDEVYT